MNKPLMRKILHIIDSVNERIGSISSWLLLVLIAVILYEVVARYIFNSPTTWAFNSLRLIDGALIVLGWAYAQRHNSHIRVDIIYTRLSLRKKALIDVIGTGLFFIPLFGILIRLAGSSVLRAYMWYMAHNQGSIPADLMYQIIILIGLCLFFLQFVARFTRDFHILLKGRLL
jgi:TRAP-type mannitol/chloroaromatic compound transport system permease small subunit